MGMNHAPRDRITIGQYGVSAWRRRLVTGTLALAIASITLVLPAANPGAIAQDATSWPAETEIWVDTVVPATALPGDVRQTLVVVRVVWDEGAVSRFAEGTPGFGVNCVIGGSWGFRPDQDEAVVRAGGAGAHETAPAGVETTLAAGDCAILRQSIDRDERNAGEDPVEFLALALIPDETPPPEGGPEPLEIGPLGFIYAGNWSRTPAGPAGPIQFAMNRMTLAPGASRSETVSAGDALIIVTDGILNLAPDGGSLLVERAVSWTSEGPAPVAAGSETELATTDSAHVQEGASVELRNHGDTPASWWFVTIAPLEEPVATPGA